MPCAITATITGISNHPLLPSIVLNMGFIIPFIHKRIDWELCACVFDIRDLMGLNNRSDEIQFIVQIFAYLNQHMRQHTGIIHRLSNDRSSSSHRKCYCLISKLLESDVAFIECAWFFLRWCLAVYLMYKSMQATVWAVTMDSSYNNNGRDSMKTCFPFSNIRESNILGSNLYREVFHMDLIWARWTAILNVS